MGASQTSAAMQTMRWLTGVHETPDLAALRRGRAAIVTFAYYGLVRPLLSAQAGRVLESPWSGLGEDVETAGMLEMATRFALVVVALAGLRDRALFLIGFAGAIRRSELVGLDLYHLSWTKGGLKIMIERSKTDADGEGAEIAIPRGRSEETCPVVAMQSWLAANEIKTGPLFRKVNRGGGLLSSQPLPPPFVAEAFASAPAPANGSLP